MSIASHGWILFSQIGKEVMEVLSWNHVLFLWYSSRCLVVVHVNFCPDMCPHLKALELVSRSLLAVEEVSTNLYSRPHILVPLKHHPGQLGHYGSPRKMVRGDPRGDLLIKKAPKLLWEQVFCIQNSFGPLHWAIFEIPNSQGTS